MNSFKTKNLNSRSHQILNSGIAKVLLFSAGTIGCLYALGGAMKILTYTVLAFKGLVNAFLA